MVGPQGPKVIVVQNLLHHSLSSSGPCWLTGRSCWKVTPGKTEGSWSGVLIRIAPKEGWLGRRNRKPKRTMARGKVTDVFLKTGGGGDRSEMRTWGLSFSLGLGGHSGAGGLYSLGGHMTQIDLGDSSASPALRNQSPASSTTVVLEKEIDLRRKEYYSKRRYLRCSPHPELEEDTEDEQQTSESWAGSAWERGGGREPTD